MRESGGLLIAAVHRGIAQACDDLLRKVAEG